MALPEENPLKRFIKVPGSGPDSALSLADWNGLLVEVGGTLLMLKAKAVGFDAVAATAIEVLLQRINEVLGPAYDDVIARAAELEARLAQLNGAGVSADAILETATRVFLTPALRARVEAAPVSGDLSALAAAATRISARDHHLSGW